MSLFLVVKTQKYVSNIKIIKLSNFTIISNQQALTENRTCAIKTDMIVSLSVSTFNMRDACNSCKNKLFHY